MKTIIVTVIFSILMLQGCAIRATKHDELISKSLSPPNGQALIYIIRAEGFRSSARSMPFLFNRTLIGELWSEQYLYVTANPMNMLLPASDGSTTTLKIDANKIYYLLYGFESSALDLFIHPITFHEEVAHFKVITETEGKKLINSYNLSGKFRRVIIGSNITNDKRKEINTKNKGDITYEYVYESDTNKGSVTVIGDGNLRDYAINEIQEICIIKNIAISTHNVNNITNASFTSLSEKFTKNTLNMQFECIY